MTFREMTVEDLEQVVEIETDCFQIRGLKKVFLLFLPKKIQCFCHRRKRKNTGLL